MKPEDERICKTEDQNENYDITECFLDVYPGIAEKIDDYKKFYELLRHNTSKFGDVKINLKKYITSECLIDVLPETTEKKDDDKKLYEQFAKYTKPEAHEDSVDGTDTAELVRFNTSKPEDKQNKSKEYVDCKMEGQSYNYVITGEINDPESLKLENKDEQKNHEEARLTCKSDVDGSFRIQEFRTLHFLT